MHTQSHTHIHMYTQAHMPHIHTLTHICKQPCMDSKNILKPESTTSSHFLFRQLFKVLCVFSKRKIGKPQRKPVPRRPLQLGAECPWLEAPRLCLYQHGNSPWCAAGPSETETGHSVRAALLSPLKGPASALSTGRTHMQNEKHQ